MYITAKLKRGLVNKIDPDKEYPVDYIVAHDGTKIPGKTKLLGKDLTEKQIISLHEKGII